MIAALMQQQYRSGRPLNDTEIAHMMIAILMGGQHTSSATGSWALLHLAHNSNAACVIFLTSSSVSKPPNANLPPPLLVKLSTASKSNIS